MLNGAYARTYDDVMCVGSVAEVTFRELRVADNGSYRHGNSIARQNKNVIVTSNVISLLNYFSEAQYNNSQSLT